MSKILIIEDSTEIRENICELLQLEGYEAIEADNGKTGYELAKEILPDLILCDIMMPVMNGHEVLRHLKEATSTASIPVVFLTANTERKDAAAGLAMGARSYINKPFEIEDLLKEVKRWI